MTQRLLIKLKRSERPAARIVCFPFAGGYATFTQPWARELHEDIELIGVNYPRDETTLKDPLRSAQTIAAAVLEEVLGYADRLLILFGYSLGAFVAYEVCQLLAHRVRQQPAELIVAACRAPTLPSKNAPAWELPDAQFFERVLRLGGTPQEVLDNAELLEFFTPILRADFRTAETYRPSTTTALHCPITAIAGSSDATTELAAVAAWERFAGSGWRFHQLEGNHFFLHQQPQRVFAIVREVLERHAGQLTN